MPLPAPAVRPGPVLCPMRSHDRRTPPTPDIADLVFVNGQAGTAGATEVALDRSRETAAPLGLKIDDSMCSTHPALRYRKVATLMPVPHPQVPKTPLTRTFCSALGGIRTPNLLIRSQMLYPLSYECVRPIKCSRSSRRRSRSGRYPAPGQSSKNHGHSVALRALTTGRRSGALSRASEGPRPLAGRVTRIGSPPSGAHQQDERRRRLIPRQLQSSWPRDWRSRTRVERRGPPADLGAPVDRPKNPPHAAPRHARPPARGGPGTRHPPHAGRAARDTPPRNGPGTRNHLGLVEPGSAGARTGPRARSAGPTPTRGCCWWETPWSWWSTPSSRSCPSWRRPPHRGGWCSWSRRWSWWWSSTRAPA